MNYGVKTNGAKTVEATFLFYCDAHDYGKMRIENYGDSSYEIVPVSEYAKLSFDNVAETYRRHNNVTV